MFELRKTHLKFAYEFAANSAVLALFLHFEAFIIPSQLMVFVEYILCEQFIGIIAE